MEWLAPEMDEAAYGADASLVTDADNAILVAAGTDLVAEDFEEQLRKFLERYPMDARAYEYLEQCPAEIKQLVIETFDPRNKGEVDYSRQVTGYIRSLRAASALDSRKRARDQDDELGDVVSDDKRIRSVASQPPTEEELAAFRSRYPLDDRAYEYLTTSSAAAQSKVLSEFRPRNEGEADYSSLVTSLVKRARAAATASPVHPGRDSGSRQKGPPGPSLERLKEFRSHFPMDDRAWDFLLGVNGHTQEVIITDFRPKRADDADYSAAVTAFVRSMDSKDRRGYQPPSLSQLDQFREKFPMDDRAFDYLCNSSADMQREALTDFLPRRLEETDFSRQLTGFLNRGSRSNGGSHVDYSHGHNGKSSSRDDRDRWASKGYSKERSYRSERPSWKDIPDVRDVREHGGRHDHAKDKKGGGGRLRAFRARYPMDDRAFDFLEQADPEVQEIMISDFQPRRQGDTDYSGAVTSFLRAVKSRVQSSNGRASHTRGQSGTGDERLLEGFRRRYPMDERAFEYLSNCDPSVQRAVVERFRPKREGESDYSGLITSFIRTCRG